jgi:hypothetical protein
MGNLQQGQIRGEEDKGSKQQRGRYDTSSTSRPGSRDDRPSHNNKPGHNSTNVRGSKPAELKEGRKHLGHISIPYCKRISEPLAHMMKRGGISTSFTTRGSTGKQLVHLKDPVEYIHTEGTIYHIQCQENVDEDCMATYVGETGRATEDRIKDRKSTTKHTTGQYTSKVKQHMHDRDHYFKPGDITILDKDSNWQTRGIRVSIQIIRTHHQCRSG